MRQTPKARPEACLFWTGSDPKAVKFVEWALYCLLAYPVLLGAMGYGAGVNAPRVFVGGLLCGGSLLLCLAALRVVRRGAMRLLPAPVQGLFVGLVLAGIATVARSASLDGRVLTHLFSLAQTGWAWVVPVAMVVGATALPWKRLHAVFLFQTCLGVLAEGVNIAMASMNFDERIILQVQPGHMVYAAGFLLLAGQTRTRLGRGISLLGVLLAGIDAGFSGCRSAFGLAAYYLACLVMVMVLGNRPAAKGTRSLLNGVALAAILTSIMLIFLGPTVQERIAAFQAKANVDTRSEVVDEFHEMASDFALFGRGALGTYSSQSLAYLEPEGRMNIESGYLQVILKGGGVMLALYLLLALPAGLLGIFRSRNSCTRALGMVIIGRLLYMITSGLPSADAYYVLFWLAIGACWNKRLRRAGDTELLPETDRVLPVWLSDRG